MAKCYRNTKRETSWEKCHELPASPKKKGKYQSGIATIGDAHSIIINNTTLTTIMTGIIVILAHALFLKISKIQREVFL